MGWRPNIPSPLAPVVVVEELVLDRTARDTAADLAFLELVRLVRTA